MIELLPPSLLRLGLPQVGDPDLETIWKTPYPVHKRYVQLCHRLGWEPYAGGSRDIQGNRGPGYITSGYRGRILNGNSTSPHPFGFAIDVIVDDMLQAADEGHKLFSRVGFYPGRGFLHLDQAPDNWVRHYCKSQYWVQIAGRYLVFDDYQRARGRAESEVLNG